MGLAILSGRVVGAGLIILWLVLVGEGLAILLEVGRWVGTVLATLIAVWGVLWVLASVGLIILRASVGLIILRVVGLWEVLAVLLAVGHRVSTVLATFNAIAVW